MQYNIRCRYTVYIADYEDAVTNIETDEKKILIPNSFITGNYPNPFNPTTNIRFYLSENTLGKIKLIKIYNVLGQLVAVIDITGYKQGWNEVVFNGQDIYGNTLSSGIYFVQLQVGNSFYNSIKINLIK